MSQRDRDFPLKFGMSLILEISDKILHLQLLSALIPIPYSNLIVKFVIQETKFAYILQISYHFAIVYLWYNMHIPKRRWKFDNILKNLYQKMSQKLSVICTAFVP